MSDTGLQMSRRIRRTPFTDSVENIGVTGFTVVNHMLLPKSFSYTVEEDYWHLRENVQIWDVSCQRQVEIFGNDAEYLVQKMTPRFIGNLSIGQCLYVPIIDENAGMINDPILLKLKDNKYWLSIADSDVLLWAKGLAIGLKLDVKIKEPEVYPLAIQGPKSEDLMVKVFGNKIKSIKYFNFEMFEFLGVNQLIARSGYSKQGGFEIYFRGFEHGCQIWNTLWEAGQEYNIRPGCPNLIERVEAGLLSCGNEFTQENNPYECNLDKFCSSESEHEFIGKRALSQIKLKGISKKIRGIVFDGDPCPPCSKPFPVLSNDKVKIGQITSGIYSPRLKRNVGLSMILRDYWSIGSEVLVTTNDTITRKGIITELPIP
tara:strand:- start:59 stop:1177 length:1119 start_codon:yes stop_codon:yes gene_type:complete